MKLFSKNFKISSTIFFLGFLSVPSPSLGMDKFLNNILSSQESASYQSQTSLVALSLDGSIVTRKNINTLSSSLNKVCRKTGVTGNMPLLNFLQSILIPKIDSSLSPEALNVFSLITNILIQIKSSSSSIQEALTSVMNKILIIPSGILFNDLTTLQNLFLNTPGATLQSDIQTVLSLINGSTTGTTLGEALNTVIANIGESSSSAQQALNMLSTLCVGNSNFSSSLYSQLSILGNTLDDSLSVLPSGNTYATVTSISSDGSGGINFTISSVLGGANGVYNFSSRVIGSRINNNSIFSLNNGSYIIALYNKSGSTILNQFQAINYLKSMYPVGRKLATTLSDKAASTILGDTSSSVRAKIASINRMLLSAPTGVIATDITTTRSLLVTSLDSTFQADIENINSLINGNATGSTLQSRIGIPIVNGSLSSLKDMIGGSDFDIATQLGDPVSGTTGLSGLMKNSSISNNSSINSTNLDNFNNASNFYDILSAFLTIMSEGLTIPAGTYGSLSDIINNLQ